MNAAVARLHAAVATARWNLQVQAAQGPGGALASARDALAMMRASVAKVDAMSADVRARRQASLIARLDREMKQAKMCVAVTIADEKRLAAARASCVRRIRKRRRACWPRRRPRSRT
jgi:hypothetical protein